MVDRDTQPSRPEQQFQPQTFGEVTKTIFDIASTTNKARGNIMVVHDKIHDAVIHLGEVAKTSSVNGREGESDMLATVAQGLRLSNPDWVDGKTLLDDLTKSGVLHPEIARVISAACVDMNRANSFGVIVDMNAGAAKRLDAFGMRPELGIGTSALLDARLMLETVSTVKAATIDPSAARNFFCQPGGRVGVGRFAATPKTS